MAEAAKPSSRKPKPLPVYFLVREVIDPATGNRIGALVPATDADRAAMRERAFRRNTRVRAQLTQPRNERFNRLVHGMGKLLAQNLDRFRGDRRTTRSRRCRPSRGCTAIRPPTSCPGWGR
ncbi:hypothetical protein D9M69_498750 [compost metagenome]